MKIGPKVTVLEVFKSRKVSTKTQRAQLLSFSLYMVVKRSPDPFTETSDLIPKGPSSMTKPTISFSIFNILFSWNLDSNIDSNKSWKGYFRPLYSLLQIKSTILYIYVGRCSHSRVHPEINQSVVYQHLGEIAQGAFLGLPLVWIRTFGPGELGLWVRPGTHQSAKWKGWKEKWWNQMLNLRTLTLRIFRSVSPPNWQWAAPPETAD